MWPLQACIDPVMVRLDYTSAGDPSPAEAETGVCLGRSDVIVELGRLELLEILMPIAAGSHAQQFEFLLDLGFQGIVMPGLGFGKRLLRR